MSGPTRERLIHLLIEERAKVIALERAHRPAACLIHESDRSTARREIEERVLINPRSKP